ncbi:hypothetical protein EDD11_003118 [Mortierella claussenii]|nr:hypothetical protein EDD11_003118 [Mortierella claussenii]
MAPKKEKMPSMKELQDLLAALDAEGGLSIGGGEGAESANLDDLYEDSYFHAILHNTITQDSINVATTDTTPSEPSASSTPPSSSCIPLSATSPSAYDILTLPQGCYWGDDHDAFGQKIIVRPGYAAVLAALTSCPSSSSQSIFLATGSSGIGKSCLAYYLVFKLFEAGHDIIISDPMFTNAFLDKTYYSCYSPHLQKHPKISEFVSSTSNATTAAAETTGSSSAAARKPTWWICDDGYLPIKETRCNVLVMTVTSQAGSAVETIHKRNKLVVPAQFQIPKWSLDEIKAGLMVALSSGEESNSEIPFLSKEQEAVLAAVFSKFKGNPKKIFAWVKSNWVVNTEPATENNPGKSKNKSKKRA